MGGAQPVAPAPLVAQQPVFFQQAPVPPQVQAPPQMPIVEAQHPVPSPAPGQDLFGDHIPGGVEFFGDDSIPDFGFEPAQTPDEPAQAPSSENQLSQEDLDELFDDDFVSDSGSDAEITEPAQTPTIKDQLSQEELDELFADDSVSDSDSEPAQTPSAENQLSQEDLDELFDDDSVSDSGSESAQAHLIEDQLSQEELDELFADDSVSGSGSDAQMAEPVQMPAEKSADGFAMLVEDDNQIDLLDFTEQAVAQAQSEEQNQTINPSVIQDLAMPDMGDLQFDFPSDFLFNSSFNFAFDFQAPGEQPPAQAQPHEQNQAFNPYAIQNPAMPEMGEAQPLEQNQTVNPMNLVQFGMPLPGEDHLDFNRMEFEQLATESPLPIEPATTSSTAQEPVQQQEYNPHATEFIPDNLDQFLNPFTNNHSAEEEARTDMDFEEMMKECIVDLDSIYQD